MKNKEKRYLDKVAQLPCACCGAHGVNVHHIREGQGVSQRASHYLTIPLCYDCHQDKRLGIHGERINWKIRKMSELDALAKTIESLFQNTN